MKRSGRYDTRLFVPPRRGVNSERSTLSGSELRQELGFPKMNEEPHVRGVGRSTRSTLRRK